MAKKEKEERTAIVKLESKFYGIDEQGFGDFDHYNVIHVRTGFKVGTKVKVIIEEVKENAS